MGDLHRGGSPVPLIDPTGDTATGYEATLFPDVYRRMRRQLTPLRPYLLQGRVESEFGVATGIVERLEFLDRHSSLPEPLEF